MIDNFSLMDIELIDGEEWKEIKGYKKYYISNMGRVISLKHGKPKILK